MSHFPLCAAIIPRHPSLDDLSENPFQCLDWRGAQYKKKDLLSHTLSHPISHRIPIEPF